MSSGNDATRIVESVRNMGVVGAGGAGFPTHVKIASKCETVIANGAECEPLLYGDKYQLEGEAAKIIGGLELAMKASSARRGIIAVKEKESRLVEKLQEAIRGRDGLELFRLKNFYPAGDEQVLVYEATGKIVPEGGIPPAVGCVVQNVETLKNIYEAVHNERPVTRRTLTCTGEVAEPSVVRAHVGATFREVIELCGGPLIDEFVVLAGGPMMGILVTDPDTPVSKLTGGLIVLSPDHELVRAKKRPMEFIIRQSRSACCLCAYCSELCPRNLLGHELYPHRIMRQINFGLEVPAGTIKNAFLCSECGLCELYACTMGLSPRRINQVLKEKLTREGIKPESGPGELKVREMRGGRRIPIPRLINRLHLQKYAEPQPARGGETSPAQVELLLSQHIGSPSVPKVQSGDRVKEGDLVADIPPGRTGACLHASIGGRVTLVDKERIIIAG